MTGSRAAPQTLREWLRYTEQHLRQAHLWYGHGAHSARDEAAWLLTHVLRAPHAQLAQLLERELSPSERRTVLKLVARRVRTHRPLAYLLHEAWLGEHRFYVDERAIVPRTFIAELLRDGLTPWVIDPARVRNALDMCTGSGCLAVLLALAFPRATVVAADISRAALEVARRNVRAYRLGRRIKLVRSDLFAGLPPAQYDLIVANPPYVDARAMRALPKEYSFEPKLALAGGADGLHFVRRILRSATQFLGPKGILVVEIGHNRRALERAFPRTPFTWLETSAGDRLVLLLSREDLPR